MIKLEPAKMTKAIERAKTIRPRVRVISASERIYSVTGSKGDAYTVRFAVVNGHKLGECDCQAGRRGQVCYHLVSAAQVNVMTQSMRRQGASAPDAPLPAPAPILSRKRASWIGKRNGNAMILDGGWAV